MMNKRKGFSFMLLMLLMITLLTSCRSQDTEAKSAEVLTPLTDMTPGALGIRGFREGTYDYVYLGTFDGKPMKWKVLSDHRNSGETDGLFLLADYGIENCRFGDTADWESSTGREWCRTFYENPEIFSEQERALILYTKKAEDCDYKLPLNREGYYQSSSLSGDYCFFLSASEAMQEEYGFPTHIRTDDSRTVEYEGRLRWWWLRSAYSEDPNRECIVYRDGNITNDSSTRTVILARPAFNMSKADPSIFFSKRTEEENTWKLTLSDEKNLPTPEITDPVFSGEQITFRCKNLKSESHTHLSVLITNKDQSEIYAYESFPEQAVNTEEVLSVSVPEGFSDDSCSVLVFAENNDPSNAVCYAGKPAVLQFAEK